jgi:hypothetical protein
MDQKDIIDLLIKLFSSFVLLGGFIFSIRRFKEEQKINREAEEKRRREEAKTKFWERQFSLYQTACEASAIIATQPKDSNEYAEANKMFWKLYWGSLVMAEGKEVASAMVVFGLGIPGDDKQQLQRLSWALANACRLELSQRWRVDLQELVPKS